MTTKEKRAKAREYQRQRYWRLKKEKELIKKEGEYHGRLEKAKALEKEVDKEVKSETKEYAVNYCPNCGVHLDHIDIW